MKILKVLSILYRDFIVYNLIFTFWAGIILFGYGRLSFPFLFWIKVLGFVFLAGFYYQTRRQRLYFYHNLGLSTKQLIAYSLAIDSIITLAFFTLIYVFT